MPLHTLRRNFMLRNSKEVCFGRQKFGIVSNMYSLDADDAVTYPEEKLYAEEF
jgi:hypothetical protein